MACMETGDVHEFVSVALVLSHSLDIQRDDGCYPLSVPVKPGRSSPAYAGAIIYKEQTIIISLF